MCSVSEFLPGKLRKSCERSRKLSTPLALQAMQDHIASAFDDWFLLQICLRESLPWCLRKESGFSAWDDRILDGTLTRSTVFCSAKKLLPERRLRRPARSLLQVHVASTW